MSTIVIRLAGVDVTDYVIFADAQFTQQTNGQAGGAKIRLKDLAHVLTPHAGQTLTLDVDGDRVWGGWAVSVSPGYFFPVDDTTNHMETERVWLIEGLDYNILFNKRFLINLADPTKKIPNYPTGTPDDEIVLDIVDNFLVLTGDGISTAGVTHVGTPNPDKPGNVGNPGTSWGACMAIIAKPNQAVFFIGPDKVLRYVDIEAETAPFGLSDTPNGTTTFGYRDMEILHDGTKLVNDALVWGAGQGKASVTFKRAEDAASIAEHGRWQLGEFTTALYTDAGVNHRAQSYVYGSPQSKRGGKDNSVQVSCTIFRPGLIAGQVISFNSTVNDYSDSLPIRRIGMKFPTPEEIEYRLYLSYDVDAPWSDYEFWFPKFNFDVPDIDINIDLPEIDWPPPEDDPQCDCGVTDSFQRTTGPWDWGMSDSLRPWLYFDGDQEPDTTAAVADGVASMSAGPSNTSRYVFGALDIPVDEPPSTITFDIRFTDQTGLGEDTGGYMSAVYGGNSSEPHFAMVYEPFDSASPYVYLTYKANSSAQLYDEADVNFTEDIWYSVRMELTAEHAAVRIWDRDTEEPSTWLLEVDTTSSGDWNTAGFNMTGDGFYFDAYSGSLAVPFTYGIAYDIANLNIEGIDACSAAQFDEFYRNVSSGWGTSTSGVPWTQSLGSGGSVSVENGGVLTHSGSAGTQTTQMQAFGGPWTNSAFDCLVRFVAPSTIPTTPESVLRIIFRDSGALDGGVLSITISSTVGAISLSDDSVARTTWVANRTYMARISVDYDANTVSATVWDGTVEPSSPDVSGATNPDYVLDSSTEFLVSWRKGTAVGSSRTVRIPYIEFDYDSKPCYINCGVPSEFDNFNRTVSPGWGTADPGGVAWTTEAGTPSVDGSAAHLPNTSNTTVTTTPPSDTYVMLTEFTSPSWTTSGQVRGYFNATPGGATLTGQNRIALFYQIGFDPFSGVSIYRNDVEAFAAFTWQESITYTMRVQVDLNATRVKIWESVDAEPGAWLVTNETAYASGSSVAELEIGNNGFVDAGTTDTRINYIDFEVCESITPDSEESPPAEGLVCQNYSGGASLFVTTSAYQPLTTKVYIDGVLQRANIDYTEQSPDEGKVLLGFPSSPGTNVTVCYVVAIS